MVLIRFCALLCFLIFSAVCAAGELSDSMQLFFDGRIKESHQNLSKMVDRGDLDARVFYFRGLANTRLGDREAASADFRKGATLEMSGYGQGVGPALQRVQGTERLQLEKHRTMARLRRRNRTQPIPTKPAVARAIPEIVVVPNGIADSVVVPRFRLASEVPLRAKLTDVATASSLVSNDEVAPGAPTLDTADDDRPVGTGVVQASGTVDADESDPFATDGAVESLEDDPFADVVDDELATDSGAGSGGVASGIFGALRALGRSVIPKVDPSKMMPPGMPGGPVDQHLHLEDPTLVSLILADPTSKGRTKICLSNRRARFP